MFGRIFLGIVVWLTGLGAAQALTPANQSATPDTQRVLVYLNSLSDRKTNRLILGQDLGVGNNILSGYQSFALGIQTQSGDLPALIGGDYGLDPSHDPALTNSVFIDHWRRGGLVTLSWHFDNPWTGNDSWDTRTNQPLDSLIHGSNYAAQNWRTQLDAIADALRPLRDAGVVVLWRPLHEMNGDWFWWGAKDTKGHETAYKKLYRHMFNYLTNTHQMNNLLWVYSTAVTFDRSLKNYYPGRGYVDLVGIDIYDDQVNTYNNSRDYRDLQALGHPMGLTEFGPTIASAQGEYDNRRLLERIFQEYPAFVFSHSWHSWTDYASGEYRAIALSDNHYVYDVFADARVVSLKDVRLTAKSTSIALHEDLSPALRTAITNLTNVRQHQLMAHTYNCRARREARVAQGSQARYRRTCVEVAVDQIPDRHYAWGYRKVAAFEARL